MNQISLSTRGVWSPMDIADRNVRYDIIRIAPKSDFLARALPTNLSSFDDVEEAIAVIGNCENYHGIELSICEEDLDSGNSACVFSAEWDEELGRYLNQ